MGRSPWVNSSNVVLGGLSAFAGMESRTHSRTRVPSKYIKRFQSISGPWNNQTFKLSLSVGQSQG